MTIRKLQENIKEKGCLIERKYGSSVGVEEKEDGMGRYFTFVYDDLNEDVSVEIRAGVIDEIPYGEKAEFVVDKETFLSLSDEMFDNFVELAVANISVKRKMKLAS